MGVGGRKRVRGSALPLLVVLAVIIGASPPARSTTRRAPRVLTPETTPFEATASDGVVLRGHVTIPEGSMELQPDQFQSQILISTGKKLAGSIDIPVVQGDLRFEG